MKLVKKAIGKKGITNGEDLSKLAKRLWGKRFIGVFVVKSLDNIPPLKEGDVAILNTDYHWYGIFKKDGKLYESDSYGMDRLGKRYKDKKPPSYFIQGKGGVDEMDCGTRLISNLLYDSQ